MITRHGSLISASSMDSPSSVLGACKPVTTEVSTVWVCGNWAFGRLVPECRAKATSAYLAVFRRKPHGGWTLSEVCIRSARPSDEDSMANRLSMPVLPDSDG